MKKSMLIVALVGLAISGMAEFRIWTDQKGRCVEAEFSGTHGKEIILKKKDGGELTVAPHLLSDVDQEYLKGKVPDETLAPPKVPPPPLKIQFKKVTDTYNKTQNPDFRDIHIVGLVNIIRKSGAPYSGYLKAYVYIIGDNQEVDGYVLLDSTSHELDLENSTEISLKGTSFIIREEKGRSSSHTQYAGYVVVIKDEEGSVIAIKSHSPKFEENYKKLDKCKAGTVFDRNFWKQKTRVHDVRYEL